MKLDKNAVLYLVKKPSSDDTQYTGKTIHMSGRDFADSIVGHKHSYTSNCVNEFIEGHEVYTEESEAIEAMERYKRMCELYQKIKSLSNSNEDLEFVNFCLDNKNLIVDLTADLETGYSFEPLESNSEA